MNPYLLLLTFVLTVGKPKQHLALPHSVHMQAQQVDTSKLAILNLEKNLAGRYFDEDAKPVVLTPDEIEKANLLISEAISQYNADSEKIYKQNLANTKKYPGSVAYDPKIKSPSGYYKQIVAATNAKGEKEVWVNCFCKLDDWRPDNDKSYWRKNIVRVMDGGSCYFNLKINLTTETIIWFKVNGVS
ncbi:hypothetical protein [Mucilaginibacter ginsenosidivorax]|uniref:Uncharacterized protein n=1 Tax=Mucilaginibacter ginsenosidivorax TaxID=862126 RepID=A0A5B8VWC1_9SPHI|nr:hypothetical protein [Mucilaginibacter ginsenosidivorax]QEC75481.1 hypothetical protein FSB76_05800 [Mucilaginibacter ginsenosidivorax]